MKKLLPTLFILFLIVNITYSYELKTPHDAPDLSWNTNVRDQIRKQIKYFKAKAPSWYEESSFLEEKWLYTRYYSKNDCFYGKPQWYMIYMPPYSSNGIKFTVQPNRNFFIYPKITWWEWYIDMVNNLLWYGSKWKDLTLNNVWRFMVTNIWWISRSNYIEKLIPNGWRVYVFVSQSPQWYARIFEISHKTWVYDKNIASLESWVNDDSNFLADWNPPHLYPELSVKYYDCNSWIQEFKITWLKTG